MALPVAWLSSLHPRNLPCSSPRDLLGDPWPFLAAWIVAAVLTVVVPVARWNDQRQKYYRYAGYAVEYENAQRAYEEANRQDNNGNNYYYPSCNWWQWKCKQRQQYYRDGGDDQIYLPSWYLGIGGQTEYDRRQAEEGGEADRASAAVRFVCVWSLIMFLGVVAYGAHVLVRRRPTVGVRVALLLYAQFALLQLLLLGQGVLETEGRALENSAYGWYGQLGVLMAYRDMWYLFYAALFSVAFAVRACCLRRLGRSPDRLSEDVGEEEEGTGYRMQDYENKPKLYETSSAGNMDP
jgi:hypothetical protein